jgi:hypothetical protein
MPDFKTGFGISQPIIGIFDPVIDENNDIKEYKERKHVETVITDEPIGKIETCTYSVFCSECRKMYNYKAANDADLENFLRDKGWRTSLDLSQAYCPACIEKQIKEDLSKK